MDSINLVEDVEDEYYYDREYYRDDMQCSVPYCKKMRRDNRGLRYFKVPTKLQESFCIMLDINCTKRSKFVCENHISIADDCYISKNGDLRLKPTASFPLIQKISENISVEPHYKHCIVPYCKNTIRNAPDKLFFPLPKHIKDRWQWCEAMRIEMISPSTPAHCCEDHFNMKKDTDNNIYLQCNIKAQQKNMKSRLKLKKGVVPHIFQWKKQKYPPSKEKRDFKKRKHLDPIDEALCPAPDKQIVLGMTDDNTKTCANLHALKSDETSHGASQELDPLMIKEETEEDTLKVEIEFEEDVAEVMQQDFDTFEYKDKVNEEVDCFGSKLKQDKDTSIISFEQFLKGCDFYLRPELASYVKTQIKRPI